MSDIGEDIQQALDGVWSKHGRMLGKWCLSLDQIHNDGARSHELFVGPDDVRTWDVAGLVVAADAWTRGLLQRDPRDED